MTAIPLQEAGTGTTSDRGLWALSIAGREIATATPDPKLLAVLEQVRLTPPQEKQARVAAVHLERAKRKYEKIIDALDPATLEMLRDAVNQAIERGNPDA